MLVRLKLNYFNLYFLLLQSPNPRYLQLIRNRCFIVQVRAQHMERASDFLVNELKVVAAEDVVERIFFVSAKECLQARQQEQKGQSLQCIYIPNFSF